MSLSLAQFAEQLKNFRAPLVDDRGRISPEFQRLLYGVVTQSEDVVTDAQAAAETAQTAADTAQTSATAAATSAANASNSAAFLEYPSGKSIVWTDVGSGYPAGNPTSDLTITARDNEGTQIATMVVRGSLTTATGAIALSVQSESATATYSIDEVFAGSGSQVATATITVTLPDSSQTVGVLSFQSQDFSVEGEFIVY